MSQDMQDVSTAPRWAQLTARRRGQPAIQPVPRCFLEFRACFLTLRESIDERRVLVRALVVAMQDLGQELIANSFGDDAAMEQLERLQRVIDCTSRAQFRDAEQICTLMAWDLDAAFGYPANPRALHDQFVSLWDSHTADSRPDMAVWVPFVEAVRVQMSRSFTMSRSNGVGIEIGLLLVLDDWANGRYVKKRWSELNGHLADARIAFAGDSP